MKRVMVIIDGLGDEPLESLGHQTPLEASFAPHAHYIATRGRIGCVHTVHEGFPIESMVCIMGLLGYAPGPYYPSGRASFEAMAKGIPLRESDIVLRCNIVRPTAEGTAIEDFTAGMISDADARLVINQVELPFDHWELFPGQSYRNILIVRGTSALDVSQLRCAEPHMHIGEPIDTILPRALDPSFEALSAELAGFLLESRQQIAAMDLPDSCRDAMLWVWSPSRKPVWPSFRELTGLRGAVVGGLDFLHGIAMSAKMHYQLIPGATGYIDTNYRAKAEHAVAYLRDFDFVLVHVNATDEEAHARNPEGKVRAIETIDRCIIGPLLRNLRDDHQHEGYRIAVLGDHATRCSDGKHTADLVPYAVFGSDIGPDGATEFTERACTKTASVAALDFIAAVLGGRKD